jgi:phage gp29-like protein
MALLDEQLVEEWLNRKNFFTIRGLKTGVDEIDLLAIRQGKDGLECWHVEVQVSFRPVGYVCGDSSAKKRNDNELLEGVVLWVQKKFKSDKKIAKRDSVLAGANWKYVFVHGVVRDTRELEHIKGRDIELITYKQVLEDLRDDEATQSSSAANNIVELLRFMQQPLD